MSETLDLLTDAAARLFGSDSEDKTARAARDGGNVAAIWEQVVDMGLPLALLSEEEGGFGLSAYEALQLIRISARNGAAVPLGETMVANWIMARAGLSVMEGMATLAVLPAEAIGEDGRLSATGHWVPWGRDAETLVVLAGDRVASLAKGSFEAKAVQDGNRLPRADLSIDTVLEDGSVAARPASLDDVTVRAAMALVRALEMAGAMAAILEIAVDYVNQRTQFGRPLGKFQAIQQQLAVLADEAAAANAACDLAASQWGATVPVLSAAVAKARAGEASAPVTAIAHQVLGAIGFTEEHRLQLFTRAIWTWRNEYGSEREWNRMLGQAAFGAGGTLWSWLTGPALSRTKNAGEAA
ncbi:acyl-CoA/acyl-ACP dehydrogenase [Sphingobium sp. DEHP117]|uniref:acyl-CoA dehydrogenase family protein n=1 Tax=Sphingobium sp. DEHP117 TaxID=2993436 RepID=UPI0027D71008|nr:acyl-CoA dehydrogenase family protein [Sphingobium sp. DEHP117]MDQ4421554.1 acyl-CoA/acyl-ACP dehydrogenase [Sphingobium sp. DEHP117]